MIRRREFIAGLGSAAAWLPAARGQPVIGWLSPLPGMMERFFPPFAQGLAENVYVVGRNVTIESREGDAGCF